MRSSPNYSYRYKGLEAATLLICFPDSRRCMLKQNPGISRDLGMPGYIAAAGTKPLDTWKNWATQITGGHFMCEEARTARGRS